MTGSALTFSLLRPKQTKTSDTGVNQAWPSAEIRDLLFLFRFELFKVKDSLW